MVVETVPLDRVSLLDLEGKETSLIDYMRDGLLLIFLRHLA